MAIASFALPRSLRDKEYRQTNRPLRHEIKPRPFLEFSSRWAHRVEKYPVLRLIYDAPGVRTVAWILVGLWAVLPAVVFGFGGASGSKVVLYSFQVCAFPLKIMVAVLACRFLVESRRDGALEMLLATPLRTQDIIRAQWLALQRIFLGPLIALTALSFVPVVLQVAPVIYSGTTDGSMGEAFLHLWSGTAIVGWGIFSLAADILAIGWLGMWLSVSLRKPHLAAGMTILLAVFLPVLFCGLSVFLDLLFFLWSYAHLQTDLRVRLAAQFRR
jgi:hypothetical protein